jgi:chemotaxis protein CheX
MKVDSVDQTVVDAVGELGNMVVGGVKRRLADFRLTMSLPSVIRAGRHQMGFPSAHLPTQLDYTFDGNQLTILISSSSQ